MTQQPDAGPMPAIATDLASALSWRPGSDKFRLLGGIFFALLAAYGATFLVIAIVRGWPGGFGDSISLWTWSQFIREHVAVEIYDPAKLHSAQVALGLDPAGFYPYGYPPSFLLVLWPLGQLSGAVSCAVLIAVGLPLYLWATVGANWRSRALFATLAAPTTAFGMVSVQTSFLTAALLAGGLRLASSHPVAGGVLLGLLTYKPQLGILVPVALVAARLWRTIASAVVTAILLVVVTSLLFGGAIWPSWIAALFAFAHEFAAESGEIRHLMPTILVTLLQLGMAPAAAQLAQFLGSATAAVIVLTLFRSGQQQLAGAGLMVAAMLATPYAFLYDMQIVTTAVIWVIAERQRAGDAFGMAEVLIMFLALVSPITLVAASSNFPLATVSMILLLGLIVRRCRHLRSSAALAQWPSTLAPSPANPAAANWT